MHKRSIQLSCQLLFLLLICAAGATNDECSAALRLYENEPVSGDNTFATSDFNDNAACGPNSDDEGVWYEIIGTGEEVELKLCTENRRILSVGILIGCISQSCRGFPPAETRASSCEKNEYASYSFFAENEQSYVVHVRANVVQLSNIMMGAQFKIFYKTNAPTDSPTMLPSPSPTNKPSGSAAPTIFPYEISDDGTLTTCFVSPPDEYRTVSETLEFDYRLPGTTIATAPAAAVAKIESELQRILADETMKCLYKNGPYAIFELATGDPDTVSTNSCQTESGESCFLVNGSMAMKIAFPGRRRQLSTEVFNDLIPVFRNALSTLSADFQGFTNVNTDDSGNSQNSNNDTSIGSNIGEDPEDKDLGSLFLLGVAAGVLLLIIALLFLHRRMRKAKFERHLKEVDDLDLDHELKMQVEAPGYQVDDAEDLNEEKDDGFESIRLEKSNHDFRSCGKPDCKHCQAGSKPTFVPTHESAGLHDNNKSVLGAQPMTYNDGWARNAGWARFDNR
jgi:hypothetical protein